MCELGSKNYKDFFYFYGQDVIDFTNTSSYVFRDVTTGTTGTTPVAPKSLDSLILFQGVGGGADSVQHL